MMPEFVHFKLEQEGPIAIFTATREEKMNALDGDAWEDIHKFAAYMNENDALRVGILTGAGDKAFIAGGDIGGEAEMTTLSVLTRKGMPIDAQLVLAELEACRKPIIAAINGYCLGGGFEVALACDIRIVSENASLGLPEVNLGLLPGAGGTQRLARVAGIGVAKQLVLTGDRMTAQEAVTHNLAMACVPQAELMAYAKKVATRIARKGPIALELSKKCINAALDTDLKTGSMIERLSFAALLSTEDMKEGTSAFLEKRHPQFQGR